MPMRSSLRPRLRIPSPPPRVLDPAALPDGGDVALTIHVNTDTDMQQRAYHDARSCSYLSASMPLVSTATEEAFPRCKFQKLDGGNIGTRIAIAGRVMARNVLLTARDTGAGIPVEQLDKIFQVSSLIFPMGIPRIVILLHSRLDDRYEQLYPGID
jgi:hypothetical protein